MNNSRIITLLSDFGTIDPYVAMMKGVILSINPAAVPLDMSHNIRPGDIFQAARFLREAYPFFPEGTIHVAVVDPGVGGSRRPIALEAHGHLFIGPDNGLFWPVINDCVDVKIVHLKEDRYFLQKVTETFHGRDLFAPVAAHVSMGKRFDRMGEEIDDPVKLTSSVPHEKNGALFGKVVWIDNFGNLITNISRKDMEHFIESGQPIIFAGDFEVKKFCGTYSEVGKGEILALINSSDMLEISVNQGRADVYTGTDLQKAVDLDVRVIRGEGG